MRIADGTAENYGVSVGDDNVRPDGLRDCCRQRDGVRGFLSSDRTRDDKFFSILNARHLWIHPQADLIA